MLGELEAIRGHRSAHSFATGPVTVEPGEGGRREGGAMAGDITGDVRYSIPFISPLLFTITPALSERGWKYFVLT